MKKKLLSLILTGAILVSALSGCGSSGNTSGEGNSDSGAGSSASEEYKFGKIDIPALDGSLCGAPIYIAYEKGFFAEEGIDANQADIDRHTADHKVSDYFKYRERAASGVFNPSVWFYKQPGLFGSS